MKIYLGGCVTGAKNYNECNGWREKAEEYFEGTEHEVLNPLRKGLWNDPKNNGNISVNQLVDRDLWDIKRCDILLVEATHDDKTYFGTATELLFAKQWHKPRVVFVGKERIEKNDPWLSWLSTHICEDLEEACEYVVTMLCD